MKQYNIDDEVYMDIWAAVEKSKRHLITHHVFDRWLSIFHGLTAINSDEVDLDGCIAFKIRDEKKFICSLLRYS